MKKAFSITLTLSLLVGAIIGFLLYKHTQVAEYPRIVYNRCTEKYAIKSDATHYFGQNIYTEYTAFIGGHFIPVYDTTDNINVRHAAIFDDSNSAKIFIINYIEKGKTAKQKVMEAARIEDSIAECKTNYYDTGIRILKSR